MNSDGRYFAWIKDVTPWIEPKLYPQLILDTGIQGYLIEHHQTLTIVGDKHILTLDEYDLTLNDLIRKYPAPEYPSC